MPVLAPKEDRLLAPRWLVLSGPVERLRPPEVGAYKPDVGTGRSVGVVGREVGVGMEVDVAVVALRLEVVVLMLPPERRDCGRFMPEPMLLWPRPASLEGLVGDPRIAPGR